MDVSRVFQEFFKEVSRKYSRCFKKKFHVAWHSSQLPEQKEGLFQVDHIYRYTGTPMCPMNHGGVSG